jgi:acyl-CoA synthetase (AMP-forming)/AMP-acid ligase II
MADDGEVYTPYGATEALPVASIESREVLGETAERCRQGAGTCVGSRFSGIEWKVIQIDDGPLQSIEDIVELPAGKIGELMVRGDVVTKRYVTRLDQNPLHKVMDSGSVWHRMGDVGYLDEQGRFWCCGRKSHRVQVGDQHLYTEPCEAIFNNHPAIHRSALVGVPQDIGERPAMIVEPWSDKRPQDSADEQQLLGELLEIAQQQDLTRSIKDIFIYPDRLPTDIRHNSKIFREQLRPWAAQQLETS